MLDDLKLIHYRDVNDALGAVARQPQQLTYECTLQGNRTFQTVRTVICSAVEELAFAAFLVQTWPMLHLPFEIVREYDVPTYVDDSCLFIAVSYSGDTEETLSTLMQAKARGAQIAVIASGGALQHIAAEEGYLFAQLPKMEHSRFGALYTLRALLQVLEAAGVVCQDFRTILRDAVMRLSEAALAWLPTVTSVNNPAKQIAKELAGVSIVIYSGPKLYPAAYKWKIGFNKNAKQIAWANRFPEVTHHELIGWTKQPIDKPYAVIDVRSQFEHKRVQESFIVAERLLSGLRPSPLVVIAQGDTILEQLLWTSLFGDYISVYLALLNELNPLAEGLIEKFKKGLEKYDE